MFEQISEAKSIKELQLSLLHRKSLISTPILSDLEKMNHVYEIFNQIESYRNSKAIKGSVIQKERFCFIILRLYSPGKILFDDPLAKGVRKQISRTLGVKCHSAISDYCEKVISYYRIYNAFREKLDYLYDEIICYLKAEKIIS